jgi:hypothetical protein
LISSWALRRTVDLGHHGWRQTLLADGDDGLQVVRSGAQGAALARWGKFQSWRDCSVSGKVESNKKNKTNKAWITSTSMMPTCSGQRAGGWRSRAAFKLSEIDDKDKLLRRA